MNRTGFLHKIMLVLILLAGFGVALIWPPLQKKIDIHYARQAAQIARWLAQEEGVFFEKYGFYTADFSQLAADVPCSSVVKEGRTVFHCPHYDFVLEQANVIRVSNTRYPKWFTVSLQEGKITCEYEEGSLVGARICSQVDL